MLNIINREIYIPKLQHHFQFKIVKLCYYSNLICTANAIHDLNDNVTNMTDICFQFVLCSFTNDQRIGLWYAKKYAKIFDVLLSPQCLFRMCQFYFLNWILKDIFSSRRIPKVASAHFYERALENQYFFIFFFLIQCVCVCVCVFPFRNYAKQQKSLKSKLVSFDYLYRLFLERK